MGSDLTIQSHFKAMSIVDLLDKLPNDPALFVTDSRLVSPGAAFFFCGATTGDSCDRVVNYVLNAARLGASMVILAADTPVSTLKEIEQELEASLHQSGSTNEAGVTNKLLLQLFTVSEPGKVLGARLSELYGNPSASMILLGITGTNGKTTTSYLVDHLLATTFSRRSLIGTVGANICGDYMQTGYTTPPATKLQPLLARSVGQSVSHVTMEVSSHALAEDRVGGITFSCAGFSNLSVDHHDYHRNEASYFAAKKKLFSDYIDSSSRIYINIDDRHGRQLLTELNTVSNSGEKVHPTCYSLSTCGPADYQLSNIKAKISGVKAILQVSARASSDVLKGKSVPISMPMQSTMVGRFNLDNVLMATAMAHGSGVSLRDAVLALRSFSGVPGRLERIRDAKGGRYVFVDYAHTPDALEKCLAALRESGIAARLFVVIGCGGDRDRSKRPLMARAAVMGADRVVFTSDNPRSESPESIIDDMVSGLTAEDIKRCQLLRDADRRRAIHTVLEASGAGDVVLIAGKGHERMQIIGSEQFAFSDQEVVSAWVDSR